MNLFDEIIKNMMEKVRNNPPKFIGNYKVLRFKDYQLDIINDFAKGEIYKGDLPKSNVLYFELENDFWCCMRPSGTEPLVRVMIEGKDQNKIEEEAKKLAKLIEEVML